MHLLDRDQTWDLFPPRRSDDEEDRRRAHHAIAASAAGLALGAFVEMAIALLSGSVGLLGDALHNLADVLTSAVIVVGFRLSKRPATPARPYGYERAEDIAGLGVALVIWATAAFAAVVSVHKLRVGGSTTHLGAGVAAALIGVVANQGVGRYKGRVGRRIHSATLVADARHSWLDALASAGALVGIVGVAVGWRWADGVAGLVVTGFIVHVGWTVTRDIVGHLMDGVAPDVLLAAERAVTSVGVEHAHVRGRWLGRSLVLDVEAFVPSETTVGDAAVAGTRIERAVKDAVPETGSVILCARPLPETG